MRLPLAFNDLFQVAGNMEALLITSLICADGLFVSLALSKPIDRCVRDQPRLPGAKMCLPGIMPIVLKIVPQPHESS
ncbi:MAG: hypothetical protein AAF483_08955 [Planctomycetota bacterium]